VYVNAWKTTEELKSKA